MAKRGGIQDFQNSGGRWPKGGSEKIQGVGGGVWTLDEAMGMCQPSSADNGIILRSGYM